MTDYIVPGIIAGMLLYGFYKGVDVFPAFLEGAKEGMKIAVRIFPTLVAMLTAIYMLRASGAIDMVAYALKPLFSFIRIPGECVPLMLLKPFSGGGALALATEVMKKAGADSYAGRVAAVMLGSSETSFYTISVYFGALKIRDTRYAVPAALVADLVAFAASALTVSLFF